MERVKAIRKNAAVADAESFRPELVENDEPRYLRRQKPVEIRRPLDLSRTQNAVAIVVALATVFAATVRSLMDTGPYFLPPLDWSRPSTTTVMMTLR